jgi:hypothetical protein
MWWSKLYNIGCLLHAAKHNGIGTLLKHFLRAWKGRLLVGGHQHNNTI